MNKHLKIQKLANRKFCCVPDMILCMSSKKVALKTLALIWDKRHKKREKRHD